MDEVIDQAADLLRALHKLDGMRKLSYRAFLAEALKIAGCDEKRIDMLQRDLETKAGTDSVQMFVRKLVSQIREQTYTRPHQQTGRLVRIYGSEQADAQIAQLRATPAEIQALAAKRAYALVGDEAFGTIEDFDLHRATSEKLRARIGDIYDEMRGIYSGADIKVDTATITPTERAAGLCRVYFHRAPGVSPAQQDWPRILTELAVRAPEPKSRSRLAAA